MFTFEMTARAVVAAGVLVAGGLVAPAATLAQDAHYWNIQYGNRARLLGGSVVGSPVDIASVYYNPGALSLVTTPELLLAGNVFEYSSLTWEDALGEGDDLSSTKFAGVPSLFAGEFKLGFLEDHRFAYSFLTRQDFDARLSASGVASGEDFPGLADVATVAGDIRLSQQVSEYWGGLTWSKSLGAHFGLGASAYVAVRNQRSAFETNVELVGDSDQAAVGLQSRRFDYTHARLLLKLGIAAVFQPWELGLTVTTPALGIWGSGSAGYNDAFVIQGAESAGSELPRIAVDFQNDVSADINSPASVGGGAAYGFGNSKLYASAEWFDKVNPYRVLDTQPFVGQTTGDTVVLEIVQELESVLNFAIGAEHQFNEKISGYTSFRTDFSAAPQDSRASTNITFWDLYHVGLGGTATVGRSKFTVGSIFAFGSESFSGIILLPNEEGNADLDLPDDTKLKYFKLTFVLGFQLAFD